MIQRLRFVAAVALMVVAVTAGLFTGSSATSAQNSSISIVDFAFSSGTITVEVGSTVTWSNVGAVTHTVTADDSEFDSGDLAPGDSYSVTFDTPGTYGYFCQIHPDMTGAIIVVDSSDDGGVDVPDDTSTSLPTTGIGSTASDQQSSFIMLLLTVAAFAALTMFRRATKR